MLSNFHLFGPTPLFGFSAFLSQVQVGQNMANENDVGEKCGME